MSKSKKHVYDCIDVLVDVSAWTLGFIDGVLVNFLACCCFEPERDMEFVKEFESGFSMGENSVRGT
jgi:hypothetical protein